MQNLSVVGADCALRRPVSLYVTLHNCDIARDTLPYIQAYV